MRGPIVMTEEELPRLMSEGSGKKRKGQPKVAAAFNLDDWVQGRETSTRTVRIYGSLSLFGDREALGDELSAAKAKGDSARVEELKAEIDALTVAMQEDVIDFRLQALTQSRKVEVLEAAKEFGGDDSVREVSFMLAEYIVEPPGVTADQILALSEWDDVQAGLLARAMSELNTRVPNVEATRPF